MRCLTLLAAAALLAPVSATQASLITVNTSDVTSRIASGDGTMDLSQSDLVAEIPKSTSVSVSDVPGTPTMSSSTTINYSSTAEQAVLSFGFNHLRTGAINDLAKSTGFLTFTATSDATFTLSGFYQLNGSNLIAYRIGLVDEGIPSSGDPEGDPEGGVPKKGEKGPVAKGGLNVEHSFGSDDTPSERFELIVDPLAGEIYTGDGIGKKAASKGVTRDLTGNLLAGHVYSFSFDASILAGSVVDRLEDVPYVDDEGASAFGSLTLTLDQVTSTPEPASFALVGLASLCGVGLRFRRRSAASNAT